MIITCAECQARFRLADEKLKPGGTKVRCSKCKHVFTVLPLETAPPEEAVDYGDFNMERVTDEDVAPPPPSVEPPPEPADVPEPPPAQPCLPVDGAATGEMDLDFSGLEQSMGPGAGSNDLAEEFSFADTSAGAEPAAGQEPAIDNFGREEAPEGSRMPGELDFDETFAETDAVAVAPPDSGPAEFTFDEEVSASGPAEPLAEGAAFDFAVEPEAPAAPGFDLAAEPGDAELSEFGFETEANEPGPGFDDEPVADEAVDGFEFGSGDSFESSALPDEPTFGTEQTASWDQPDKADGLSFNFDEPSFETQTDAPAPKAGEETPLSFGEIDFSDEDSTKQDFGTTPNFGGEPDFSQATLSRPAETAAPAVPPPPPSRPAAERPRSSEPLRPPPRPRKSPMSRVLLILILLLLILCGAGGYFYFLGGGAEVVDRLLQKAKGEEPAGPVEQRISLAIAGSSYVDNRDAGQLLVIQGAATNNFAGARSAITVKGVIIDAGGKVLQQQTVFCGNPLSEEKLRAMKYAQIEEAMNNQFGDSLTNMNLKAGATIPFTIVFRNVPKEMANINVEVVDSKPGGL